MDARSLPIRVGALPGMIVPDAAANGRRSRLAAMPRGSGAVVGHTVPLAQLPASAHLAELASCTSTGRRCATGWGGCASCSARS